MSAKSLFILLFVSCLLATGSARAQTDNLSGLWTLQASGFLPETQDPCTFQGTAQVTQTGSQISGTAELGLTAGPDGCPAELIANLTGVLEGTQISGTLLGGNLGEATFTGSLGTAAAGAGARAASGAEGGYDVTQGPFLGVTGGWAASLMGRAQAAIPTLSAWTLLLLASLLLVAGGWLLRRRHLF